MPKSYEKRRIDFLEKISDMYQDYDFSFFEYIDGNKKSSVICNKHGIFSRNPYELQRGRGCPECISEKNVGVTERFKGTLHERREQFIKNAIDRFGIRYCYNNIDFINSYTLVKIICPDHGEFEMSPHAHLQSFTGCPICAKENTSPNYVKLYKNSSIGKEIGTFYKILFTHIPSGIKFIKIGITSKSIFERYKNGYDDFKYEILEQIQDTNYNCAVMEQCYKTNNKENRFFIPDGIVFCGSTETYNYDIIQNLAAKGTAMLRESLLKKQGGVCPLCKRVPIRPVLDHDHSKRVGGSGLCRGTLCSDCNIMIAKIENNCMRYGISQKDLPDFLRNFANNYKESGQEPFLHPNEKPKMATFGKREFNKVLKYWSQAYPKRKPPEWKDNGRNGKVTGRMNMTKQWEKYIEDTDAIHFAKYS